jgi:HTH-type transcriptional regulator/antitoxin HigA
MATTAITYAPLNGAIEEYVALVRAFPLVHIRDDAHLNAALAVFGPLFEKRPQTSAEQAYLAVLTDLIESYEDATVRIPSATGLDALRFLMDENGTTQAQLAPIFGSQSVVSEVLAGKKGRRLTVEQIKGLAAYYHVAPATFID